MKVIDLLNKIANGEDVPEEIVFEDKKYRHNIGVDYEDEDGCYLLSNEPLCFNFLNTEVEIIEEKKIPEKLNLDTDELRGKETPRAIDYLIESKINEVIDYLKSKGE